jgi:hypothetical protein
MYVHLPPLLVVESYRYGELEGLSGSQAIPVTLGHSDFSEANP